MPDSPLVLQIVIQRPWSSGAASAGTVVGSLAAVGGWPSWIWEDMPQCGACLPRNIAVNATRTWSGSLEGGARQCRVV